MASDAWPEDIPIWIDGAQKWMTGLTRRTTCDDVIYALLYARGLLDTDSTDNYAVFERWRAVERPLQGRTKIVKVWSAWGGEQPNVQLLVQRLDDYFIPPEAAKTRRRHRRSNRQRARHSANCRCMGRPQCARCGRLKAVEQLAKHLVKQERHLQDLKRRVQDTDRQIAEHETRQHARRVQRDGRDYVQDSYLFHHGSDNSSSGSEDSVDWLLMAVGEEALDDYLNLCNSLHDVVKRLEHAHHMQQSLAREIEATASQDNHENLPSAQPELDALQVELTRAVAASVLQQQQELELSKELQLWEAIVRDRDRRVGQLQQQLHCQAQESSQTVPPFIADSAVCSQTRTDRAIPQFYDKADLYSRQDQMLSSVSTLDSADQGSTMLSKPSKETDTAVSHLSLRTGTVSSHAFDRDWIPGSYIRDTALPRSRSRSKERYDRPKPPMPLPRSCKDSQNRLPGHQPRSYNYSQDRPPVNKPSMCSSSDSSSGGVAAQSSTKLVSKFTAENTQNFDDVNIQLNHPKTERSESYVSKSSTTHSAGHHTSDNTLTHQTDASSSSSSNTQHHHAGNGSIYQQNHTHPGLSDRHFELYSSSKDDSGVSSSDSSTDSGLLLFEAVDHTDSIGEAGRRQKKPSDPDSFVDVSLGYSKREFQLHVTSSSHSSSSSSSYGNAPEYQTGPKTHDVDQRLSVYQDFEVVDGSRFPDSVSGLRETSKCSESSDDYVDTVPVIVTTGQHAIQPVSIISSGRHKGRGHDSALSRAKTVRFADEMTSWTWCDDADSSLTTQGSALYTVMTPWRHWFRTSPFRTDSSISELTRQFPN